MKRGTKILAGAALFGLALLGASARGDDDGPGSPPAVSSFESTVGGKPALCFDVVDADGAGDLLGYGYQYTLADGSVFGNPLAITLWVVGKQGLVASDLADGKRVCFTKLPGNVVSVQVTATDRELHTASASASAPASLTAGHPTFGVPKPTAPAGSKPQASTPSGNPTKKVVVPMPPKPAKPPKKPKKK